MKHPSILILVIASFGIPEYIDMIRFRKLQLKKYAISHIFLFDELPPAGYIFDENDLYIEKSVNTHVGKVNPQMNPFMIQRFLKCLRQTDLNTYDFIVRVNISTFIDFSSLIRHIDSLPRNRCASAPSQKQYLPEWELYRETPLRLMNGTCMIFSIDCIHHILKIDLDDESLTYYNDDTVLSHTLNSYIETFVELPCYYLEDLPIPKVFNYTYPVYRIKHIIDRSYDILNWIFLLRDIDKIEPYV